MLIEPVSILADSSEVLTLNAVINTGNLDLTCLGTDGNRDLQWEATSIASLNNGEITAEAAAAFPGFNVTYLISNAMYQFDRSFILLSSPPDIPLVTGYITCKSRQSNRSSVEVFVTPMNPLWRIISPPAEVVPMGADVNIVLQYGDNSVGFRNMGPGFVYNLRFLPCVATQPDEVLLMGITEESNNTVKHSFHARLLDSGEYLWNGMILLAYKLHVKLIIVGLKSWIFPRMGTLC